MGKYCPASTISMRKHVARSKAILLMDIIFQTQEDIIIQQQENERQFHEREKRGQNCYRSAAHDKDELEQ